MLKIALTGNIASGKSEVEKILIRSGFKTLCLDMVTNEIYKSDEEFKTKLFKSFGTYKKEEISKFIFNDSGKLRKLESIIYPKIKDRMFEFFNKNTDEKVVIVSAPMLFESGFDIYFDKIIFVSASCDIRLKRLILRNKLTEAEGKLRINSQNSEEEKISKSNYVIINNSTLDELHNKCNELIKELNTL